MVYAVDVLGRQVRRGVAVPYLVAGFRRQGGKGERLLLLRLSAYDEFAPHIVSLAITLK